MSIQSSTAAVIAMAMGACGGSGSSTESPSPSYRIVAADGSPLTATEGEALHLTVVAVQSDGTTTPLSANATVVWSGPPLVTALPEGSTPAEGILPKPGANVTAMWVRNPDHLTDAQLNGVLYVLDRGSSADPSISVTATISGGATAGSATAAVPVAPFPTGDVTRGLAAYMDNCASCHGAEGQGTSVAPALNHSTDSQGDPNLAADPSWNGPLFALTPLDNMDNAGVSLSLSMPRWLITETRSGKFLGARDLADIFAFLQTQTTQGQ